MEVLLGGVVAAAVGGLVAWLTQQQQLEHQRAELSRQLEHQRAELSRQLEHQRDEQSRQLAYQAREHAQQLEHETREVLRRTYAELLVAQRRSREASLRLAEAGGGPGREELAREATAAHDEFIYRYHELNLDSTGPMWLESRGLRDVLDDMLKAAKKGDDEECQGLRELARDARQNLERSLRNRLGHEEHQERNDLGKYDKVEAERKNRAGESSGPLQSGRPTPPPVAR
jgi:hypothetical protein